MSRRHHPRIEIAQAVNRRQGQSRAFTGIGAGTQLVHQNQAPAIRFLQDVTQPQQMTGKG